MITNHKSYEYANKVMMGMVSAPKYVKLQCIEFINIAKGKRAEYYINEKKADVVDNLTKLMIMPKGLKAGQTVYEAFSGFQHLFIIAILCTVHREDPRRRKYQTAILEICRKNGKTFLIAVIFIILFLTEPKFSKFFSVAPDGALSREVQSAIKEIIKSSPALSGKYKTKDKFRILRDKIVCNMTENEYVPLNYSNSRLDGKLPSAFLADEVGALPNSYAVESMRSGQLTILNKLGCIISTKYPLFKNPFEDEVQYAMKVLDGLVEDETVFALLYEPDDKENWMSNDEILLHGNPLAIDMPELLADLKLKRQAAIEMESKRENFLCKHCNIIYQGIGTETYIAVSDLIECREDEVRWSEREVYLGIDLSMSNDNCSIAMVSYDEDTEAVLAEAIAFFPEDKMMEKTIAEKVDYFEYTQKGWAVACGTKTVDYAVIEAYVLEVEKKYNVKVMGIAYDRYNALSSAQKFEAAGYVVVEVRQHSSVLHPATKWLEELVLNKKFQYEQNTLYEINFENARCTFDTNLNRYVNKKKSAGKVDMVVSTINALYLLQQNVILYNALDWAIQVI